VAPFERALTPDPDGKRGPAAPRLPKLRPGAHVRCRSVLTNEPYGLIETSTAVPFEIQRHVGIPDLTELCRDPARDPGFDRPREFRRRDLQAGERAHPELMVAHPEVAEPELPQEHLGRLDHRELGGGDRLPVGDPRTEAR